MMPLAAAALAGDGESRASLYSPPAPTAVEKDSLSETLLIIAANHGNDASVKIVADYASHLSDDGRDALIRAIGEGYYPTRFADYPKSQSQQTPPP